MQESRMNLFSGLKSNNIINNIILALFFITLMAVSRLLPHPPNLTPTIVLSLLLTQLFSKKIAVFIFILSQFLSDFLLGFIHGYEILGSWSFFVYSGLIFLILFFRFNLTWILAGTVLFWLWTNLGVFLFSGLYLANITGFFQCYILALPFLGWSVLGTVFYYFFVSISTLDRVLSNRVFFTAL